MNERNIKVSISVVTYNHQEFIAQALDSIVSQKVNFEYEILIGEDDSSDGTREICIEYAKKFPKLIRLFLHKREDVLYIDGCATGRRNFCNNLAQAKGQYIALLEGDDFWTCNDKLQKQVDLLDAHPETTVCFHDAQVPVGYPATTEISDLFFGNYIPTCSVMFRNLLQGNMPKWFFKTPMGDWPLLILLAEHGNIRYINEVMGCYREHPGGLWSGTSKMARNIRTIKALHIFADYFSSNPVYSSLIRQSIEKHNTLSLNILLKNWLDGLLSYGKGISSVLQKRKVKSVAIFGCREIALCLMKDCRAGDIAVVSFIDNNVALHGSKLEEVPINPPEFLANTDTVIDAIILSIEGMHEAHVKKQLANIVKNKEIAILSWKELLMEVQQ